MFGGTLFLLMSLILLLLSAVYSSILIVQSTLTGVPSSPGEAILGAALFVLAVQMGVAFLVVDMSPQTEEPLQVRAIQFLRDGGCDQVDSASMQGAD
jgi:hypothetical protein